MFLKQERPEMDDLERKSTFFVNENTYKYINIPLRRQLFFLCAPQGEVLI